MIELVTGLPGSGKSQLVVSDLLEGLETRERPVYVNITGLDHSKLRTFQLTDPLQWNSLPEGSLIIIDECQEWFPARPSGSKVPEHCEPLEVHRHKGYDLIFITQHPSFLDQHVRKLTERHRHCVRPFGLKYRNIYEWNACNESPQPKESETTANVKRKTFSPAVYSLYKSATIHTDKARLPWAKLIKFGLIVLMVVFCVCYAVYQLNTKLATPSSAHTESSASTVTDTAVSSPSPGKPDNSLITTDLSGSVPINPAEFITPTTVISYNKPGDLSSVIVRINGQMAYLADFFTYKLLGNVIVAVATPNSPPIRIPFPSDLYFDFNRPRG